MADQEFINDRIAELMAEEPLGNEMQASSPDVFQKQEQAIESFLGGIGQFADEKNIPFLQALADPSYTRNVAGNLSFGAEMTPGLGDIQAIREGSRMMGDDQPLMGGALMAASIFTTMPSAKLKGLLKKAEEKLDSLRQSQYTAQSKMKPGLSKADFDEGWKDNKKIQGEKFKTKKEITEIEDALANPELPFDVPPLTQTGRRQLSGSKSILPEKEALERSDRFLNIKSDGRSYGFHKKGESTSWFIDPETNEVFKWYSGEGATPRGYHVRREVPDFVRKLQNTPKQVRKENLKGIVNANAETRKLYQEIIDSSSTINTTRHNKVGKETSEQFREIQKGVDNADLEERNEIIRLLARFKNKKPK